MGTERTEALGAEKGVREYVAVWGLGRLFYPSPGNSETRWRAISRFPARAARLIYRRIIFLRRKEIG